MNSIITYGLMGADAIDKTGNPCQMKQLKSVLNSDAILFGAIGHPKYDNDPTAKVRPEQGLLETKKIIAVICQYTPCYYLSVLASSYRH